MNAPKPTIKPLPDGPFLVEGLSTLTNAAGALDVQPKIALCRCGASANKPFCDGAHTKIGFSGAKVDGRNEDRKTAYAGKRVTIHDNRGLCAHAGVCTDRVKSVWRMGQEPWIDPDGAAAEQIIDVVRSCPSGALSCSVDGEEYCDTDREPAILVSKNGPYVVTGGPELTGEPHAAGSSEHYTLCRCGASKNKPFCDGSHWGIEFRDDAN